MGGEQQNLNIQIRFSRETPEEESAGTRGTLGHTTGCLKKASKENVYFTGITLGFKPAVITETRNMNELKNY